MWYNYNKEIIGWKYICITLSLLDLEPAEMSLENKGRQNPITFVLIIFSFLHIFKEPKIFFSSSKNCNILKVYFKQKFKYFTTLVLVQMNCLFNIY